MGKIGEMFYSRGGRMMDATTDLRLTSQESANVDFILF